MERAQTLSGDSMPAPASRTNCRFGAYQVDRDAGELRKSGVRIRIQEQSFRVLTALLERPGEVVAREELRRILWPDDTFVDFEHSLNAAVNKLREVLGDSANHPRFVETVPRRGYRFIYPVEAPGSETGEQQTSQANLPAASWPPSARPLLYSRRVWIAALTTVAAAIAVSSALNRSSSPDKAIPLRAVPLTSNLGTEADPSFSPEGTQLAFTANQPERDNYDIYIKTIGSAVTMQLTSSPAPEYGPAWSPDGRWIAFLRDHGGKPSLHLISPLGGEERKVADVSPSRGGIAWWPDGKSLVASHRESLNDPFALYRISVETGRKQQLTTPPRTAIGDNQPAFSPDGQNLAFARWESSGDARIYLTDLAGANPRVVTPTRWVLMGITWTADSREIVFSDGPFLELLRIPARGGEAVPLDGIGVGAWNPVIAASTRRLVYEQTKFDPSIWRYDLSAATDSHAGPERFIASTQIEIDPQFSPTGQQIAFGSDRSGDSQIWVCDADMPDSHCLPACDLRAEWAGSPRWSRDSKRIAFDMFRGGEMSIVAVDLESRLPIVLTVGSGENSRPSWSHDGKWVYFGSNRSGAFEIWKAKADGGGEAVRVTRDGGYNPFASANGQYLYYVKGYYLKWSGQTEVWRMELSSGKENPVLTLPPGMEGAWDLVDEGIFFLEQKRDSFPPQWVVQFHDFETQRVYSKWVLKQQPTSQSTPFDISSDRQWLIYSTTAANRVPPYKWGTADLMLVEDFR